MKNINITKYLSFDKWSNFVYNHPNGNVFQTPEMYEVYKNTKKYEPVFLAVIDEKDEILGTLLAVIQKEYSGFLGNFTARSIIFGGPLIKNNDAYTLNIILQEYNKVIRKKTIYSQFRNMREWGDLKEVFIKNGFEYEKHLNIIVDLNKNEEELWKEVNTKRRNEIRRAKKEGTTFSVKSNFNDLHECYSILKSVYKKAKLPFPNINFFEHIFKNNDNNTGLKLFCACNENKIIGCMFALVYKNTIYDFYAGAYPEYYNKYPNDLIPYYLNAADTLLLTSKWEGSVNVIKEALACNLPIVSTDVGDVKLNISGVDGCYVCKQDVNDLTEKLNLALSFGQRTNGRQRIIELGLDSDTIAVKLIEVYNSLLK